MLILLQWSSQTSGVVVLSEVQRGWGIICDSKVSLGALERP
jgi:hypothetical protein